MRVLIITALKIDYLDAVQGFKNHSSSGAWVGINAYRLSQNDEVSKVGILSLSKSNQKNIIEKHNKVEIFSHYCNPVKKRFGYKDIEFVNKVVEQFEPDLIDVQGTEFPVFDFFVDGFSDIPVVYTLQGFPQIISRAMIGALNEEESNTMNSILAKVSGRSNAQIMKRLFKRGKTSDNILSKSRYIIGHTQWDEAVTKSINYKINYYCVNRTLRDEFYISPKWDALNANKHSIFSIQGTTPAKGLHILLKALSLVKNIYPDVRLSIPGITYTELEKSPVPYYKLICKEISQYGIKDNVVFLGKLNAHEIIEQLRNSRVFVSCSLQENSPNSLAEAQLIGVPCITSAVGGAVEYINNGQCGMLYDAIDYIMCSQRIISLFEDDDLCSSMSSREIDIASKRHDIDVNCKKLVYTYKQILSDFKKRIGGHEQI